ncbi:MAG: hypothetical protein GF375_00955 [Candidatus Omnitrophica bacterium]|nr:hypothetical protein [Candidatus Omnitrophota bacterium]MBD3268706.1 hypothetical protein [Candidatus Omnitrophota bacterium]
MKQKITSLEKDFVASNLRSQLTTLQNLLSSLEREEVYDTEYTIGSLKKVEGYIKRLRGFLNG